MSIKWQIFNIVDNLECSCTEFWDFIYKIRFKCTDVETVSWQTCKSHKLMLRTPSSLEWNREQQQAALGLTFRILTVSALTHLHSWVISSHSRSVTRRQIYATLHAARQVMRRQGLSLIFGAKKNPFSEMLEFVRLNCRGESKGANGIYEYIACL